MARAPASKPKKLGRPPDSDSAETRQRIVDAGRIAFATHGYEVATNRSLASAAAITSGALYHYFGSKLDLYTEIYREVQTLISGRFAEAIEPHDTFHDRLHAILDAAHDLNVQDPTLAQFLGAVRIDRRRHAEVDEAIRTVRVGARFFPELVDFGVGTGEIAEGDRATVLVFLDTILTGLTDAVSSDPSRHAKAIESVKRSIDGTLFAERRRRAPLRLASRRRPG
jgi:AcrR family transcriptional regulator